MDTLLALLQEEVSYLRELLANLIVEEKMLLSPLKENPLGLMQERGKLHARLRAIQKKKKGLHVQDPLEIASLAEQISSLAVKIKEKKDANQTLKKMKQYELPKPLPQKEKVSPQKKSLLLEEENS